MFSEYVCDYEDLMLFFMPDQSDVLEMRGEPFPPPKGLDGDGNLKEPAEGDQVEIRGQGETPSRAGLLLILKMHELSDREYRLLHIARNGPGQQLVLPSEVPEPPKIVPFVGHQRNIWCASRFLLVSREQIERAYKKITDLTKHLFYLRRGEAHYGLLESQTRVSLRTSRLMCAGDQMLDALARHTSCRALRESIDGAKRDFDQLLHLMPSTSYYDLMVHYYSGAVPELVEIGPYTFCTVIEQSPADADMFRPIFTLVDSECAPHHPVQRRD